MKAKLPYPAVHVVWSDIVMDAHEDWKREDDEVQPEVMDQVAMLVSESDDWITLASCRARSDGAQAQRTTIPRGCVKSITHL